MAQQPGFQKAYLQVEGGEKIEAWFNPKEYALGRQNKWEVKPVPGAGLPSAQFGGSDPHKLQIELLFDDSDARSGDVRTISGKLLDMMEVDPKFGSGEKNNSRPPMVEFGWGSVLTFKAVCETLNIQYTLFKPDGTPIRAIAKLGLTQVSKATTKPKGGGAKRTTPPAQNPTTIAIGGVRSHVIRDGDSLQSIAYAAYGDATRWRVIAEANGIDDPVRLRRGTILAIPRLSE
jgi:Contractile injection system tube protein/LysM domain